MKSSQDSDPLQDEAIRWLLRMHSPECSADQRRAFDAWLAADPRHREAYARVEAQWQWMEPFKSRHFRAREDALRYRPPPRRRYRRLAALALAAALLLALGLTGFTPEGWYGSGAAYRTVKGGREQITLADGSRLELNTDSQVNVHLNRWRRRVEVVRGEVFFSVVHAVGRPFEVEAGDGRIIDLGTEFEVYVQPDRVLVAVQEGRVRIEARDSLELTAGQQAAYGRRGGFLSAPVRDIAALTAWRQGRMIFRDRPLDEVLAEVGRYHDVRIGVADPAQRRLRVSGAFRTANLDAILDAIALTLPIEAERFGDRDIVLKPRRADGR